MNSTDAPDSTQTVKSGQVYASTHSSDISDQVRQQRIVVAVDDEHVWLRSENHSDGVADPVRRLKLSKTKKIPGHRLVRDAPATASAGSDLVTITMTINAAKNARAALISTYVKHDTPEKHKEWLIWLEGMILAAETSARRQEQNPSRH